MKEWIKSILDRYSRKNCLDCVYFLEEKEACVHPKVKDAARVYWWSNKTGFPSVDLAISDISPCGPGRKLYEKDSYLD